MKSSLFLKTHYHADTLLYERAKFLLHGPAIGYYRARTAKIHLVNF
jgi:hypothetical protein